MMVLITYDVCVTNENGPRRLRRVARACESKGQRVQNSVFECVVDPAQWVELKRRIEKEIDPTSDSLRYYFMGKNWQRRVEHVGAKPTFDPEDLLII